MRTWNPKRLVNPEYPAYSMQNHHLKKVLGITGKLPDQGIAVTKVQGWSVLVLSKHNAKVNSPGARSRPHRIVAICPDCCKVMSAGRTHQHKCKAVNVVSGQVA